MVNLLCSVWGVSKGIMGRGCMGSGFQMWAVWVPPTPTPLCAFPVQRWRWKPFLLGELLCCRHKFRQTTGVDCCTVLYCTVLCVCVCVLIFDLHFEITVFIVKYLTTDRNQREF